MSRRGWRLAPSAGFLAVAGLLAVSEVNVWARILTSGAGFRDLRMRSLVPMTTEASMSAEPMRWYPSKVDWWLALLLCVPPVTSVAVCVALVLDGKASELPWGVAGVVFIAGIYFGLVFPMRYGLDDAHLLVRFGVCRQRIPLADISEVHPTHNPLSSPALSLDRLHVQFGPGFFKAVMISPAERNRFLDDLAQKAGLQREGDRLVRG